MDQNAKPACISSTSRAQDQMHTPAIARLPAELSEMIFENVFSDPTLPPVSLSQKGVIRGQDFGLLRSKGQPGHPLLLVSKRWRDAALDAFFRCMTFQLTIDPSDFEESGPYLPGRCINLIRFLSFKVTDWKHHNLAVPIRRILRGFGNLRYLHLRGTSTNGRRSEIGPIDALQGFSSDISKAECSVFWSNILFSDQLPKLQYFSVDSKMATLKAFQTPQYWDCNDTWFYNHASWFGQWIYRIILKARNYDGGNLRWKDGAHGCDLFYHDFGILKDLAYEKQVHVFYALEALFQSQDCEEGVQMCTEQIRCLQWRRWANEMHVQLVKEEAAVEDDYDEQVREIEEERIDRMKREAEWRRWANGMHVQSIKEEATIEEDHDQKVRGIEEQARAARIQQDYDQGKFVLRKTGRGAKRAIRMTKSELEKERASSVKQRQETDSAPVQSNSRDCTDTRRKRLPSAQKGQKKREFRGEACSGLA